MIINDGVFVLKLIAFYVRDLLVYSATFIFEDGTIVGGTDRQSGIKGFTNRLADS